MKGVFGIFSVYVVAGVVDVRCVISGVAGTCGVLLDGAVDGEDGAGGSVDVVGSCNLSFIVVWCLNDRYVKYWNVGCKCRCN